MQLIRKIGLILSAVLPMSLFAQELTVIKDLDGESLTFVNGEFVKAEPGESLKVVYFRIEPGTYEGEILQIRASQNFSLFVNGQLGAMDQKENRYNIDSLRRQFGSPQLLVAVHQKKASNDINVKIVSAKPLRGEPGVEIKPGSSLRDFAIVATLLLLGIFIALIRLNPKLTSDYFSLYKILSLRETDDNQIYSRITSSSNILFYVFCSLMAGFTLTLIFEFTSITDTGLRSGNFGMAFFQWVKISLVILSFFFLKILLVYSLSLLFGIKGVGGVHFFYWIRVLLVSACVLTIVLFLYFISRGQQVMVYETVLWVITTLLILIIMLVFLKLMRLAECSFFHLFSYICATEIIPFLITLKLLHQ